MRSTPSLRNFPNVALETVPNVGLIDDGLFLVLSRKSVERFLFLRPKRLKLSIHPLYFSFQYTHCVFIVITGELALSVWEDLKR